MIGLVLFSLPARFLNLYFKSLSSDEFRASFLLLLGKIHSFRSFDYRMVAFAGLIYGVKMFNSSLTLEQNLFHLFVSRQVLVSLCVCLSLSLNFISLFPFGDNFELVTGNENILYASSGNEIKSFDVHTVI